MVVRWRGSACTCGVVSLLGDVMEQQIVVKRKNVYGNEMIYPVCDTAKNLTMLANTKTLTPAQISIIKALGYTVVLQTIAEEL